MPRSHTSSLPRRGAMAVWLMLLAVGCTTGRVSAVDDIDELQWQNRIILLRAGSQKAVDQAHATLKAAKAGIDDRHIAWFILGPDGQVSTNLDARLGDGFHERTTAVYFAGKTESVVLIGKDGGVKVEANALDLTSLYATIDQMPMRRAEMRRQAE